MPSVKIALKYPLFDHRRCGKMSRRVTKIVKTAGSSVAVSLGCHRMSVFAETCNMNVLGSPMATHKVPFSVWMRSTITL